MSYESDRYDEVKNFRVEACERAFLFRHEPLLKSVKPWELDPGFTYSGVSLPKGKFASVEAALEAARKVLDGG